jgi:regulator of protease activity HflC (stomatin/prohibitin superfamily)
MEAALWSVALVILILAVATVLFVRLLGLKRVTVFEHQRGIRYVRGKYTRTLGPGQYWFSSLWTTISIVDVRVAFVSIPGQEVLTADGVTVKTTIAASYEVEEPYLAVTKNQSYIAAMYLLLQLALREIVSTEKIDSLLEGRAELGKRLVEKVGPQAKELGLHLISADAKDLMLPADLKKVYAQVVKAQKESQALLEKARSETAALRSLANAAKMIEDNPNLLQLRALQIVEESAGRNTLMLGVTPQATVTNGNTGEKH